MNQKREHSPVRVLIAGSIMQLFLGVIYIWSVFVLPASEYFSWDIAKVKLTSSFMLCCFVLGILAFGRVKAIKSTQQAVLLGGLLLSAGMISSGLLPPTAGPWIYLTYGIVGGLGVGLGYNAILIASQRNFPHKRGLATGISVCSFGFSTVIFAPLAEAMMGRMGLSMTLISLGVVFLVVTVLCFSFIRVPEQSGGQAMEFHGKKQYSTEEMLKTKEFYYITLAMMLGTATYFILNPSFKTLAVDKGLSAGIATLIVMITGVANALGRLFFPVLSDKLGSERTTFLTLALTVVGAVALMFVGGMWLILAIAIIAFCYGGYSGIFPILTGDYFGMKNLGANYGCVMVGFAISALFMPMILGYVESLMVKMAVLAILAAIGAVGILLLKRNAVE